MANAESIVRELDLERSKGVRAGHLAYGEQRRLEIALAMATQPRLLLLDEPTAGMSMPEALELVSWLQRLPRTVTMLIVEHNMDVVFGLADQIMVLYYGEMLADGPAAEVLRNPSVMSVYLGDEEIL
jgi:ABC-type branched-subunit amino acid transport system ATPase component